MELNTIFGAAIVFLIVMVAAIIGLVNENARDIQELKERLCDMSDEIMALKTVSELINKQSKNN